jgi:hypothetical protein
MKKIKKKKAAEALDDDAWRKLVKEVSACTMYNLQGLAAEAGLDVRYASALLQTYYHGSRTLH